jgi:hypothetical protein
MDGHDNGAKRARTQQEAGAGGGASADLPGREQLLLTSPDLQTRLGQKFCDESDLLSLLLARGLVRRVRTIQLEVRPLGGDSFKVTLDASKPTMGEAKAEIARSQGTVESCQELYKVAMRADGLAVREDDAEPELLEDENFLLGDGEVLAMAVKESPLLWRAFAEDRVTLSERGAVATHTLYCDGSLTTSGIELTEGKHYWEVELLSLHVNISIGVCRPNLDPAGFYCERNCTEGWFIECSCGGLYGNGKEGDDHAGCCNQGDRVGVLLDLNDGSIRFLKNGALNGPGYPAGSVTGPVVAAVQMFNKDASARLLTNAEAPAGM